MQARSSSKIYHAIIAFILTVLVVFLACDANAFSPPTNAHDVNVQGRIIRVCSVGIQHKDQARKTLPLRVRVPPSSLASASTSDLSLPKINPKDVYYPEPNSMKGKQVMITGANSGLGLESAKRLAAAGANVIITARTAVKVDWTVNAVNRYLHKQQQQQSENKVSKYGTVIGIELDLDDLKSVKSFSTRYEEMMSNNPTGIDISDQNQTQIDVLMNNAGCGGMPKRELTVDGFERTFQSNHLSHFVLTATLFPYFNREGCRVINVSSLAHAAAHLANSDVKGIDMDNLVMANLEYNTGGPYQQSKLANILFTQELQRRADAAGMGDWFKTVSIEPGVVATAIWRYILGKDPRSTDMSEPDEDPWSIVDSTNHFIPLGKFVQRLVSNILYRIMTSTELGSNSQVYVASALEIEGGRHYGDDMQLMTLDDFAQDGEKARELWKVSEDCGGIKFFL